MVTLIKPSLKVVFHHIVPKALAMRVVYKHTHLWWKGVVLRVFLNDEHGTLLYLKILTGPTALGHIKYMQCNTNFSVLFVIKTSSVPFETEIVENENSEVIRS